MNITEIIKLGLEQSGRDGLVCPGICGCEKDNLSPAGCLTDSCEPGYKHIHSLTGEWIIKTKLDPISDDDIQQVIYECS